MGQHVSSCVRPPLSPHVDSVPLPDDQPVYLPAPPAVSLCSPSAVPVSPQLAASLSTTPRLPSSLVSQVYQRALYLYHCPLSSLSWQYHTHADGASSWISLLTSQYSAVQPPSCVPLSPADYLLRPSLDWFPALLARCSSLHITIHLPPSPVTAHLPNPYFPTSIHASSPSLPSLLCFLPHLISALSIYPPSLFERMGLQELWLCDNLTRNDTSVWVPVFEHRRLYVDCMRRDAVDLLSVIHHELFHFMEYSAIHSPSAPPLSAPLTRQLDFPDPTWSALNPPHFQYGTGGVDARGAAMAVSGAYNGQRLKGPFVNRYSQSGMEEDRAEIYAALVRDRESVTHAIHRGIRAKGEEIQRRLAEWSDGLLDEQWWHRTQKAGGGACFSHTRHARTVWGRLTNGRWMSMTSDKSGSEYWYNYTTDQSVNINPNIFVESNMTCIDLWFD